MCQVRDLLVGRLLRERPYRAVLSRPSNGSRHRADVAAYGVGRVLMHGPEGLKAQNLPYS